MNILHLIKPSAEILTLGTRLNLLLFTITTFYKQRFCLCNRLKDQKLPAILILKMRVYKAIILTHCYSSAKSLPMTRNSLLIHHFSYFLLNSQGKFYLNTDSWETVGHELH